MPMLRTSHTVLELMPDAPAADGEDPQAPPPPGAPPASEGHTH